MNEAVQQLAFADQILLNKVDLVTDEAKVGCAREQPTAAVSITGLLNPLFEVQGQGSTSTTAPVRLLTLRVDLTHTCRKRCARPSSTSTTLRASPSASWMATACSYPAWTTSWAPTPSRCLAPWRWVLFVRDTCSGCWLFQYSGTLELIQVPNWDPCHGDIWRATNSVLCTTPMCALIRLLSVHSLMPWHCVALQVDPEFMDSDSATDSEEEDSHCTTHTLPELQGGCAMLEQEQVPAARSLPHQPERQQEHHHHHHQQQQGNGVHAEQPQQQQQQGVGTESSCEGSSASDKTRHSPQSLHGTKRKAGDAGPLATSKVRVAWGGDHF